jgi:hypothetical protein
MLHQRINYPVQSKSEYISLQEFKPKLVVIIQCFGQIESRPDQDILDEYKKYLGKIIESIKRCFVDKKVLVLLTGSADNGNESLESANYLSKQVGENANILVVPVFVSSSAGMDYMDNLRAGLDIADLMKVDRVETWTDRVRRFKHRICLVALGQSPKLTRWVNRLEPNNPKQNTWKQTCHGLQLAMKYLRMGI